MRHSGRLIPAFALLVAFIVSTALGGCAGAPDAPPSVASTAEPVRTGPVTGSPGIIAGHARFTLVTSTLVRCEWSPDGVFEDRRSLFATVRPDPSRKFTGGAEDTDIEVDTDRLHLKYTDDGKPFSADNLKITVRHTNGSEVPWRPGMKESANLGGTIRTLDGVSSPVSLGEGLLSRDGWHVVDDSHTTLLTDEATPWITPRREGERVDWYFFGHGTDYKAALRDLTTIGGRVPLPSRYTLGTWYSRYWPFTSAEYRAIVAEYEQHGFPLDNIVLDMDWHEDGWTGYSWNRKLLPDAEDLLAWFHAQGLHVTMNLHPAQGVGQHETAFPAFARAMRKDPATTDRIPFDITDPVYVKAYFEILHHPLERAGVDFWWMDWQQGTSSKLPGLDPLPWINQLHFADRGRAETGLRGQSFSRWGGLGDHRHPIHFSGDAYSSFPMLAFEVAMTATASNVGCFFWSHDIGGHMGPRPSPELYTRWVQFGCLSAAMRSHSTRSAENDRRPWLYGEQAEKAMKQAFELRARLFPYIYSSARRASEDSVPLIAPMYFDHPDDSEAYTVPEQYMLGADILVAPITTPGSGPQHVAVETVWFPKGVWYRHDTGERHEGPGFAAIAATIDEVPLFVRAGAPIPLQNPTSRMTQANADPLIVQIFAGADGETEFCEDDGESAEDERSGGLKTRIQTVAHDPGAVTVTVGALRGHSRSRKPTRHLIVNLCATAKPDSVTVDGRPLPEGTDGDTGWSHRSSPDGAQPPITIIRLGSRATTEETRVEVRSTGTPGDSAIPIRFHATLREAGAEPDSAVARELAAGTHVDVAIVARGSGDAEDGIVLEARSSSKGSWSIHAATPGSGFGVGSVGSVCAAGERLRIPFTVEPANLGFLTGEARFLTRRPSSAVSPAPSRDPRNPNPVLTVPLAVDLRAVTAWSLLGPFDGGHGPRAQQLGPERDADPSHTFVGKGGRTIAWKAVELPRHPDTAQPAVDLHAQFPATDATAFAQTWIHSEDGGAYTLLFGSDDGAIVWVNGVEVLGREKPREFRFGADTMPVTLTKGWNRVLVKVDQGDGEWGFTLAFDKTPELASLRQSATSPPP